MYHLLCMWYTKRHGWRVHSYFQFWEHRLIDKVALINSKAIWFLNIQPQILCYSCTCNKPLFIRLVLFFFLNRSMSRPIVVCIWRGKVHVTSCFFGIARFFDTGSTKYTFWIGRQSCKRLDRYAIIKYHFSIWNNMHRQYIKYMYM